MAEYFHPPKRPARQEPVSEQPEPRQSRPAPVKQQAPKSAPQKKRKKQRSPFMLLLFLMLLLGAAGIFLGRMFYYTGEERYAQTAEAFVEAVVLHDEDALAQYVHPDMYGSLRPRSYGEVEACEAEAQSSEAITPDTLEISVEEAITQLYRVHVSYRVQLSGESYVCSMDVYVANIGGEVYAVKTEAINDSALP